MPASTISNRTTSTVLEEYYQAASKSLLLRQLEQASDICQQSLKTLLSDTSLHLSVEGADWLRKLWLLRVAIVTAHLDTGNKIDADAIQQLLTEIRADYQSQDIHPDVVASIELLALKSNEPSVARSIAEQWLTGLSDQTFQAIARLNQWLDAHEEHGSVEAIPPEHRADFERAQVLNKGYERVVELYVLRVLPVLQEWELASEFLEYNDILRAAKRRVYIKLLRRLRRKALQQPLEASPALKELANDLSNSPTTTEEQEVFSSVWSEVTQDQEPAAQEASTSSASTSTSATETKVNTTTPARTTPEQVNRPVVNVSTSRTVWWRQTPRPIAIARWLIIIVVLIILRGITRQDRVHAAIRTVLQKFWQTLRMGTTVTYI